MINFNNITHWRRLCYRSPKWKPGHCKHQDGFAREHWTQPNDEEMERRIKLCQNQGLEAFWEDMK